MAFTLAGRPVPSLAWEEAAVTMTADEALALCVDREKPGPDPETRKLAEAWLRDLLANGPMPSKRIVEEGKSAGYSRSTLHRAKDTLKIKPYREHFGGAWSWKLPEVTSQVLSSQPVSEERDLENLGSWDSRPETGNLRCVLSGPSCDSPTIPRSLSLGTIDVQDGWKPPPHPKPIP